MSRYGIVTDLNRCVRCRTCYVECKRSHDILAHPRDDHHPYEYYRLRYVEWERGRYPTVKRSFIPLHCVQCDEPICIRFCPIDAISKRKDGIIHIDRGECNGCGVCAMICPYGALYIDHENKADACDLCVDRSIPACVEMCPAGAKLFGDLDDPDDKISKVVKAEIAKPLIIKSAENRRVFYIPSPNEKGWESLEADDAFKQALEKRKKDLPPVKGIL
ncbi:MAG: 4Fe-4S binding protein [Deltaproteobacteria bacterium]|nr:4Fe-4S binding protein [Deltaproteobacteria bacterium]